MLLESPYTAQAQSALAAALGVYDLSDGFKPHLLLELPSEPLKTALSPAIGSSGQKVQQMQEQLNRIARNYPALPTLSADGIYGQQTANAVRIFQSIFDLPQTGVVDYATWYEISEIYVGVSQISEPN